MNFKNLILTVTLFSLTTVLVNSAEAKKIKLSEGELARESVLPVFEKPTAVRNRNINFSKRLELGFIGGMNATEELYNPYQFGLTGTYYLNNLHGIQFMGSMFLGGLNSTGQDLQDGKISCSGPPGSCINSFDPQKGPEKNFLLLAHWKWMVYYGKISLSKTKVMNLSFYTMLGGGGHMTEAELAPTLSGGIGQKFFLNKNFALGFEILANIYQTIDVTKPGSGLNDTDLETSSPDIDPGEFEKSLFLDVQAYLTATFLL